MVIDLVKNYVEGIVGRTLFNILLVLMILGVVAMLAGGTNALVALGIPRNIAGSFVTLLVISLCIYGMYWFATEMIDW
ncbi:hypothetical protein ACFQJ7_10155 [Halovenus rubra]|uniref:Uncharacterized protein n=2 Tax=Halovenus rubra TaxID=869890 RepID=A0ABD5XDD4_9EURY|nr:hypothetical protein [Halovenus rubra]